MHNNIRTSVGLKFDSFTNSVLLFYCSLVSYRKCHLSRQPINYIMRMHIPIWIYPFWKSSWPTWYVVYSCVTYRKNNNLRPTRSIIISIYWILMVYYISYIALMHFTSMQRVNNLLSDDILKRSAAKGPRYTINHRSMTDA